MVEKDLLYQSKASQNTGQQQQERAQDAGQLQGYGGKREDSVKSIDKQAFQIPLAFSGSPLHIVE